MGGAGGGGNGSGAGVTSPYSSGVYDKLPSMGMSPPASYGSPTHGGHGGLGGSGSVAGATTGGMCQVSFDRSGLLAIVSFLMDLIDKGWRRLLGQVEGTF